MKEHNRRVYNGVEYREFKNFVENVSAIPEFVKKKELSDSQDSHFVRYTYKHVGEKISIVLDTKAKLLTVTAMDEDLKRVDAVFQRSAHVTDSDASHPNPQSDAFREVIGQDAKTQDPAKASKGQAARRTKTRKFQEETSGNNSKTSGKQKKSNRSAQSISNIKMYGEDVSQRAKSDYQENRYVDYDFTAMRREREQTRTNEPAASGIMINPRQEEREIAVINQSMKDVELFQKNDRKPAKIDHTSGSKQAMPVSNAPGNGKSGNISAKPSSSAVPPRKTPEKDIGGGLKSGKQQKLTMNGRPAGNTGNDAAKESIKKGVDTLPESDGAKNIADYPEYKNGYSVKNFTKDKLDQTMKHLKGSGLKVQIIGTISANTPNELKTYAIEDSKKQKVYLRHMIGKNIVQLQGKRSNLFGEIQVQISKDSDYLSAVNSHIEFSNEPKEASNVQLQAGNMRKLLKKSLPDAYDYLSEQSKIDLSIGMIDIGNQDVRLSDYSVLLVPPYRGLERLIYDLQKAENIDVKMIGQAYEKVENCYSLKSGYLKKIKSVIYNEVLTALYTEYFEKRNYYAHSDNTPEAGSRIISDKLQAEKIFQHLLYVINYNCKKLKEIGFSL